MIPLITKKVQEAVQKQPNVRQIQSLNIQAASLIKNPQTTLYSKNGSVGPTKDPAATNSPSSFPPPTDISPLEQEVIQMMSNLSAADNIALIGDAGQGERLVQAKKNILKQ